MPSTYPSIPVIDQVTSLLVQNAVGGQFRATAGGPVIGVTDLVGTPLTELTTNAIGLSISFLAPDVNKTGVVTFGGVAVPVISNEARDAGLQAEAARVAAVSASSAATQAVLDAGVALTNANAAFANSVAPTDTAVDAGIVRAGALTSSAAASTYALRSPDFQANRAYAVGELVVQAGVIYRRIAAGSSASFVLADWAAITSAGSTVAAGTMLVLLWNGTNFVDPDGVVATATNRPPKTYRTFTGGPDAAALGLKIDGDQQIVV